MDQALLVSVDEKLDRQQIMMPLINCHYYGQILLFICGETLIPWPQRFTYVSQRVTVLLKHCAHTSSRGVSLNVEGKAEIRKGRLN
jgi:hypothetical protein